MGEMPKPKFETRFNDSDIAKLVGRQAEVMDENQEFKGVIAEHPDASQEGHYVLKYEDSSWSGRKTALYIPLHSFQVVDMDAGQEDPVVMVLKGYHMGAVFRL